MLVFPLDPNRQPECRIICFGDKTQIFFSLRQIRPPSAGTCCKLSNKMNYSQNFNEIFLLHVCAKMTFVFTAYGEKSLQKKKRRLLRCKAQTGKWVCSLTVSSRPFLFGPGGVGGWGGGRPTSPIIKLSASEGKTTSMPQSAGDEQDNVSLLAPLTALIIYTQALYNLK